MPVSISALGWCPYSSFSNYSFYTYHLHSVINKRFGWERQKHLWHGGSSFSFWRGASVDHVNELCEKCESWKCHQYTSSSLTHTLPYTCERTFLTLFDILSEHTEKCQPGNLETFVLLLFKADTQCFQSISFKGTAALALQCFSAGIASRPRFHVDI